jgi:RimJ/RimL family protein N-acetyltransferase
MSGAEVIRVEIGAEAAGSEPQVRLEPIRLDWAEALSEGDAVFSARFGISVEPDWAGFPEAIGFLLRAARAGVVDGWGPRLFFDADHALVGNGGWKGPPDDHGYVELGYAVAPSRQRRGIATSAVRELLTEARGNGASVVVAHTLATPNASTRVLERCGFSKVGEVIDPDEGPVWRWEFDLHAD